jgi:hypothetical protein
MSEMGVKALDAVTSAANATCRLWATRLHGGCRATPCVVLMGVRQNRCVDVVLESVHTAFTLESAHRIVQLRINQPKQCRHRCAITQVWFILNDNGFSRCPSNYDSTTSRQRSTDYRLYERHVIV